MVEPNGSKQPRSKLEIWILALAGIVAAVGVLGANLKTAISDWFGYEPLSVFGPWGNVPKWGATPVNLPTEQPLDCTCVSIDNIELWRTPPHPAYPAGTKVEIKNECPTDIRIWAVRNTSPVNLDAPTNSIAPGREYLAKVISPSQSVTVDLSGAVAQRVQLEGCPSNKATIPVPPPRSQRR